MRATRLEYRIRFLLHALIFSVGLFPLWEPFLNLTDKTSWQFLITLFSRQGWLNIGSASIAFLAIAIVFLALGAFFRVWGSAYVGASVVNSPSMHGQTLLADGPYRYTRNPLYLGTLLHTVGVALIMPPAGAIFAIAAIWILQVRLALAEEPFLTARFGKAYLEYQKCVPQFLPALKPMTSGAGMRPRWLQAFLGESYMVGVFLTFAIFGWQFNHILLLRGLLISLGISLVLQALLPRPVKAPAGLSA